jgi:hypothetical protein
MLTMHWTLDQFGHLTMTWVSANKTKLRFGKMSRRHTSVLRGVTRGEETGQHVAGSGNKAA